MPHWHVSGRMCCRSQTSLRNSLTHWAIIGTLGGIGTRPNLWCNLGYRQRAAADSFALFRARCAADNWKADYSIHSKRRNPALQHIWWALLAGISCIWLPAKSCQDQTGNVTSLSGSTCLHIATAALCPGCSLVLIWMQAAIPMWKSMIINMHADGLAVAFLEGLCKACRSATMKAASA